MSSKKKLKRRLRESDEFNQWLYNRFIEDRLRIARLTAVNKGRREQVRDLSTQLVQESRQYHAAVLRSVEHWTQVNNLKAMLIDANEANAELRKANRLTASYLNAQWMAELRSAPESRGSREDRRNPR